MEDYVQDTLTASPYPFWITMLLFVGISAFINYIIVYSKEKARRKVEEETVAKITKEIESVKESYNKALEKHKVELQKDFESYKYRVKLCNSIDEQLIELIYNALNNYHKEGIGYPESDDRDLISSAYKISNFLSSYYPRYSHINQFEELRDIATKIKIQAELDCAPVILSQYKTDFIHKLNLSISIFLPKFT